MRPAPFLATLSAVALLAISPAPALADDGPREIVIEPDSLSPAPPPPEAAPHVGRGRHSAGKAPPPEAAPAEGVAGTARGLFWEAHPSSGGGKGKVYLFGSIHVATPAAYPLPAAVEKAFSKSSALVVEADTSRYDSSQLAQMFNNRGNFPPGVQSLHKTLPAACFDSVSKLADDLGLAAHNLNDMKPWLAAIKLEGLEAAMAGLQPELGIDLHFIHEAHGRKRIVELEGVTAQLDLFNNMPEEQQIAMVCETANEAKSFELDVKRMYRAWSSGDANGLSAIIDETNSQDRDLKPAMDALLTVRNRVMADKIQKYLDGDSTWFVVVGAAHLVGPTGIVSLLQRQNSVQQQ